MVQVKDWDSIIEFDGELIGESSSRDRGNPRWTQIMIYRVADGKAEGDGPQSDPANDPLDVEYVVSREGRTLVVHGPDCTMFRCQGDGQAPDADAVPCDICMGDGLRDVVWPEVQRYHSTWAVGPWEAIDALRLRSRRDDSWFVPSNSMTALREAANNDAAIRTTLHKSMRTRWPL